MHVRSKENSETLRVENAKRRGVISNAPRGASVLKHFYVMRATSLTFRKTSTTIDYTKTSFLSQVFIFAGEAKDAFHTFKRAYFRNHS